MLFIPRPQGGANDLLNGISSKRGQPNVLSLYKKNSMTDIACIKYTSHCNSEKRCLKYCDLTQCAPYVLINRIDRQ